MESMFDLLKERVVTTPFVVGYFIFRNSPSRLKTYEALLNNEFKSVAELARHRRISYSLATHHVYSLAFSLGRDIGLKREIIEYTKKLKLALNPLMQHSKD
jgi:hypothetical protein